jgi:hypothetical protein
MRDPERQAIEGLARVVQRAIHEPRPGRRVVVREVRLGPSSGQAGKMQRPRGYTGGNGRYSTSLRT